MHGYWNPDICLALLEINRLLRPGPDCPHGPPQPQTAIGQLTARFRELYGLFFDEGPAAGCSAQLQFTGGNEVIFEICFDPARPDDCSIRFHTIYDPDDRMLPQATRSYLIEKALARDSKEIPWDEQVPLLLLMLQGAGQEIVSWLEYVVAQPEGSPQVCATGLSLRDEMCSCSFPCTKDDLRSSAAGFG